VFALFNLLEEVVIRRTRPFIRMAYPNATIRKRAADGTWSEMPVRFPERKLKTVYYNLEATYVGIYDEVVWASRVLSWPLTIWKITRRLVSR